MEANQRFAVLEKVSQLKYDDLGCVFLDYREDF